MRPTCPVAGIGAMAIDILTATQIHMHGQLGPFPGRASPETIHWGARSLTKKTSPGVWAKYVVTHLQTYGVLYRQIYADKTNLLDLTDYKPRRAKQRRNSGIPEWLRHFASSNVVRDVRRMRNAQDVVTEIRAGRPVIMASSYAFSKRRDRDGFVKPYLTQTISGPLGLLRRTTRVLAPHAMVATGYVDGKRPGIVIQNSHGNRQRGPNPYNFPAGAFAVDLKYIDMMVKDWHDCWSLGNFVQAQATQNPIKPVTKSWIIVLSTENCQPCLAQLRILRGRPYRIVVAKVPKRLMDQWGFSIYPTTVIVEGRKQVKVFKGLTPWEKIKPYAGKAFMFPTTPNFPPNRVTQNETQFSNFALEVIIRETRILIAAIKTWFSQSWNIIIEDIANNMGMLKIPEDGFKIFVPE